MNTLKFLKFWKIKKAAFIRCCDFKCVLIPSTDKIGFDPNAKINQDHTVCRYGYKLISADDRYSKLYKT